MKRRWHQSLFVIVLLASQNLCSFGKQIPPSRFIRSSNIKISHHLQLPENEKQSTATQKVGLQRVFCVIYSIGSIISLLSPNKYFTYKSLFVKRYLPSVRNNVDQKLYSWISHIRKLWYMFTKFKNDNITSQIT